MLDFNRHIGMFLNDPEGYSFEAMRKYSQELQLGGWCPPSFMSFLNVAVSSMQHGNSYLEIGSWCGRSLCGALKDNDKQAVVIDPLEHTAGSKKIYDVWYENTQRFRNRVTLHRVCCEHFYEDLPPIEVFLYDGNHDSGHTYEGLNKFERYLTDRAIIMVDDYFIRGGDAQEVFPGHKLDVQYPVKTDVDKWIMENKSKIDMVHITKMLHGQVIIYYRR
jgi:hypothetical protein